MPGWWASLTAGHPLPGLILLAIVVLPAAGFGIRSLLRHRDSPDELEKKRRTIINRNGKLGDGEIIDIEGTSVLYSYSVAGVGYTTSQDMGTLETLLPPDRAAVIGPVSIKFLPEIQPIPLFFARSGAACETVIRVTHSPGRNNLPD